jgi:3-oxoacyl-[acyl-carrier protein] reductase
MVVENKVCIITGSAGGIGKAAARMFAANKAKVIICDINPQAVEDSVQELSAVGEVNGFTVDVTNPDDIREMVEKVIELYGTIDVLINNAGITADSQLVKMTNSITMYINAVPVIALITFG